MLVYNRKAYQKYLNQVSLLQAEEPIKKKKESHQTPINPIERLLIKKKKLNQVSLPQTAEPLRKKREIIQKKEEPKEENIFSRLFGCCGSRDK